MNVKKSAEEAVKTVFFGYTLSTGLHLMMSDGVFSEEYQLYSNGSISESQYYMYGNYAIFLISERKKCIKSDVTVKTCADGCVAYSE